jgi:hypothetical protein
VSGFACCALLPIAAGAVAAFPPRRGWPWNDAIDAHEGATPVRLCATDVAC